MGDVWIAVVLIALLTIPVVLLVLALSVFTRVRRLESLGSVLQGADTLIKLDHLERRLGEIELRLAATFTAPRPASGEPTPTGPPAGAQTTPGPPRAPGAGAQAPAAAPDASAAVAPDRPPPRGSLAQTLAAPMDEEALESLIGGRWLNYVGIVVLLLAAAFFLKYAFDNAWLGPRGRVGIGLLSGSALLVGSQWLLSRGHRYFSEGIAGLGAAVLYLSLYAASSFYELVPQSIAFVGMMTITAAVSAIAVGRDSQRLALVGLAGGFLTPFLISTGADQQVILFTYLIFLDAGLLMLARHRDWGSLELPSLAATQIYFWGWYARFYDPSRLASTAAFATVFFVLFAALPVVRGRRLTTLPSDQVALVLANAGSLLVALHRMLWPVHRWTLTGAAVLLAAGHLVAARWAAPAQVGGPSLVRLLYAGLALTFVTIAIPYRLEGSWITAAWAVEGAVLIWSGFATRVRPLRAAGFVLFIGTGARLWTFPGSADRLLLNPRFGTLATAVACIAVALFHARRHSAELDGREERAFAILAVAVNILALWALSLEAWDFSGRTLEGFGVDPRLARQLSLSLLWTLYATCLVILGVWRDRAGLRWQGLALLALVVGKAFIHDLSFLQRIYRVISFLVLGVMLMVLSFLYQRRLAARAPEAGP